MAPQQLQFRFLGVAIGTLALRAERQTVDVATDPTGNVPGQRAAPRRRPATQLVGEKQEIRPAPVHVMGRQAGERRGAIRIADGWDGRARLLSRRVRHRAVVHVAVIGSPMIPVLVRCRGSVADMAGVVHVLLRLTRRRDQTQRDGDGERLNAHADCPARRPWHVLSTDPPPMPP